MSTLETVLALTATCSEDVCITDFETRPIDVELLDLDVAGEFVDFDPEMVATLEAMASAGEITLHWYSSDLD